jgi:hypothetical protein
LSRKENTQDERPAHTPAKRRWWQRLNRVTWWFFLILLALALSLWLAIRTQSVQQYIVDNLTQWLSKDLGVTVKTDSIHFTFFDQLIVEGLYVEDQKGDTLLYCEQLVGDLNMGIMSILENNYKIKDLYLTNTKLYISRDAGEKDNNLQFLIDYFGADKDGATPQKEVLFDMESLSLDNFWFQNRDAHFGETQAAFLPKGRISIKDLDIPKRHIVASSILVDGLQFHLLKYPAIPLPATTAEAEATSTADSTAAPWVFEALKLDLANGLFKMDNSLYPPEKNFPKTAVDFDHLLASDISVEADSLRYSDWEAQAIFKRISLKERSGFELDRLAAKATVTPRRTELTNLILATQESILGDTLIFKYRAYTDFRDFTENVLMQGHFSKGSKVSLKDIMAFAPDLERNAFFRRNKKEIVTLSGDFSGRVNNLRANDLYLRLSDGTSIEGNFRSRDLTLRGEEYLDLELKRLKTSMKTLRLLIPNFDPPVNFDKLHTLDFKGRFTGFFTNFVADGNLSTPLGRAQMDIQLDLKQGKDKARYAGTLDLVDFDLGAWTEDPQLGKVTFRSKVADGIGLTAANLHAKLNARVESLAFKSYTYKNLYVEGLFDKKLFEGTFNIQDDNLDLDFDGTIDFNERLPSFDFKARIKKIDLQKLNLAKTGYNVQGDVSFNFMGNNASNIQGEALVRNLNIKHDSGNYQLDSLWVESKRNTSGNRALRIRSDVADLSLEGVFELNEMADDLLQFLERRHPEFMQRLKLSSKKPPLSAPKHYAFAALIKNTKNWLQLLDPKMDTLINASIKGDFDNVAETFNLEAEAEKVHYGNVTLNDLVLFNNADRDASRFDLGIFRTEVGSNVRIPVTAFYGEVRRDTVHFNMTASNFSSLLDNLNLNGNFFLAEDNLMQVTFAPSALAFYNEKWDILADNYIRFKEKYIETKNFRLSSRNRSVFLQSIDNQGILLQLQNVDIGILNDFLMYEPLQFGGLVNLDAKSDNIFKLEDLTAHAQMDTLWVNGDNLGKLMLAADTDNLKKPLDLRLSIEKGEERLLLDGNFIPSYAAQTEAEKNAYEATVTIEKLPLKIAEYFLKNDIKDTEGRFDGLVNINGTPSGRPNIKGSARVYEAAITIDYTKTRYFIRDETATITNSLFGVQNAILKDEVGNTARVTGGITHNHLQDFGLNVRIQSDNFLFLRTKEEDNSLFYGTAYGSGFVEFTGTFKRTNLYINATTRAGMLMHLPLGGSSDVKEVSFIKFRNPQDSISVQAETRPKETHGLNIDMDLNATPEGEIQLIFDEQSGDIIKGSGKGDIQLHVTREGDFTMNGEYTIERGEYLFTLPIITDIISLNKPFIVKKGGTIQWSGDPFNAQINLEASYSNLKTPLYPFIEEYLSSAGSSLESVAKQPTRVDLTLLLRGLLMKPDIDFLLSFPELQGQLKSIADTKLVSIQENKDDLNRQVALLILTGQFIPSSESSLAGGGIAQVGLDVGLNTLSEFISNQLSQYLSGLLSEVIPDLDVGVTYRQYDNGYDLDNIGRVGREIELKLSKRFFDDRINLNLSQDFDINNQQGQYYSPEFVLEYLITSDGRFKLRVFKLNEQELTGMRIKWGAGINYSVEFDSFFKKKGSDYDSPQQFFEGFRDAVKQRLEE